MHKIKHSRTLSRLHTSLHDSLRGHLCNPLASRHPDTMGIHDHFYWFQTLFQTFFAFWINSYQNCTVWCACTFKYSNLTFFLFVLKITIYFLSESQTVLLLHSNVSKLSQILQLWRRPHKSHSTFTKPSRINKDSMGTFIIN